jgi:diguanylate cyclase (GGDEF)-like protein
MGPAFAATTAQYSGLRRRRDLFGSRVVRTGENSLETALYHEEIARLWRRKGIVPNGMADWPVENLVDLIDTWLAASSARLDQRFAPGLEQIYVLETTATRRRAVWISSLAGCITAIALVLPVWRLLSDAHATVRLVWLELGLPISCVSHLLIYAPLNVRWQEGQVAIAGVLTAASIAVMLSASVHGDASLLLGSVVLILLLGIVGSRFPFIISAVYAVALLAVFIAGIERMQQRDTVANLVLFALMTVISFYAAFGNWRLEAETRRSYALMLRERLSQQELSSRNTELNDLALRDALTGLANRRAYDSWMESAWHLAHSTGTHLGLIIIDVDNFKLYNDHYGHPGGDACLQSVATCLLEQRRGTHDLLARFGGEEFAVILPNVTLRECGDVADRLRSAIVAMQLPHQGLCPEGMVTISLGVASVVPGAAASSGAEELVRLADQALYAAKQGGRDCVYLAAANGGSGQTLRPHRHHS